MSTELGNRNFFSFIYVARALLLLRYGGLFFFNATQCLDKFSPGHQEVHELMHVFACVSLVAQFLKSGLYLIR